MSNDNLPKWIDDAKGKDPFTDDLIAEIIRLRDAVSASGAGVPGWPVLLNDAKVYGAMSPAAKKICSFEAMTGVLSAVETMLRDERLAAAPTPDRAPHASTAGQDDLEECTHAQLEDILLRFGIWRPDDVKERIAEFTSTEAPDLSARDASRALYTSENWEVREAALEEAAVEVEEKKVGYPSYFEINEYLQEAADAIRALRSTPVIAPAGAVTDKQPIELGHGSLLKYEPKTTGAPGWLMYNEHGLIRSLTAFEILLVESVLAKSKGGK